MAPTKNAFIHEYRVKIKQTVLYLNSVMYESNFVFDYLCTG